MKQILFILVLLLVPLSGCGGTTAQASTFCQSVSTVKDDVNTLRSLKSNFSLSALKTQMQKLQTSVNQAIAEAKGAAKPQVSALKSSMTQLKGTLTQVKGKTMTVKDAIPTLRSQAQTVAQNWEALTEAMKC